MSWRAQSNAHVGPFLTKLQHLSCGSSGVVNGFNSLDRGKGGATDGGQAGRAIEDCYSAFARCGLPNRLEASPMYGERDFFVELSAVPLRRLPQDQLGHYAASAMTTVGGVDEYKHFLPRILELALTGSGWHELVPDRVAHKLIYGSWRSWPALEQRAVGTFYSEAWKRSMRRDPEDYDAVPWLTGIALLGLDVAAACSELLAANSANASLHLSSFISARARPFGRAAATGKSAVRKHET